MKQFTISILAAFFLLSCNHEEKKPAADTKSEDKVMVAGASTTAVAQPMPDSATIMKNWQAYMTPGKEHQLLKDASGTWTAEVTSWMSPGAAPIKSTAVEESKMILGGRYQEAHLKGSFSGQPFEGMNLLGFDNKKQMFVSTWIDNMGTGVMNMEGAWDPSTNSMTMRGTFIDPTTGKDVEARQIFRIIDKDHHFAEMFCKGADGKEYKSMEISYSRKK